MTPLRFFQMLASGALICAVLSAFGGGRIARSIGNALVADAAHFTHTVEGPR